MSLSQRIETAKLEKIASYRNSVHAIAIESRRKLPAI